MGTTADKLEYLDGTKSAIKQAIVNKGVAVPDGTTFRAYADKIASIQDVGSLPTQGAKTVTPTTTEQVAVASGRYTTGDVIVAGDANLKAENIAEGVSIFGVTGTHSASPKLGKCKVFLNYVFYRVDVIFEIGMTWGEFINSDYLCSYQIPFSNTTSPSNISFGLGGSSTYGRRVYFSLGGNVGQYNVSKGNGDICYENTVMEDGAEYKPIV